MIGTDREEKGQNLPVEGLSLYCRYIYMFKKRKSLRMKEMRLIFEPLKMRENMNGNFKAN